MKRERSGCEEHAHAARGRTAGNHYTSKSPSVCLDQSRQLGDAVLRILGMAESNALSQRLMSKSIIATFSAAAGLMAAVIVGLLGCSSKQQGVVIYVSEDQVFSEPILRDFERDTGIRVLAVYDTEEAKSTGVMNRLLAEKNNPQADVYWANEPIRAEVLKQQGVAASYQSPSAEGIPANFKDPQGYWTGFSARARVLIVNQAIPDKPKSITSYADPASNGRAVIANPLFGTTTTEIAAVFILWGDEKAKAFLADMKRNNVKIATSNGESADFVASGQFAFALADSDDVVNRMKQGKPVELIYPDQGDNELGCFIVPNAVVLINGGRHPEAARKLADYLLSRETERKLALSDAAQIPLHEGMDTPAPVRKIETIKTMKTDYAAVARKMQEIEPLLKQWVGY
jgi:iron(III) transport system substrate-binding protein